MNSGSILQRTEVNMPFNEPQIRGELSIFSDFHQTLDKLHKEHDLDFYQKGIKSGKYEGLSVAMDIVVEVLHTEKSNREGQILVDILEKLLHAKLEIQ